MYTHIPTCSLYVLSLFESGRTGLAQSPLTFVAGRCLSRLSVVGPSVRPSVRPAFMKTVQIVVGRRPKHTFSPLGERSPGESAAVSANHFESVSERMWTQLLLLFLLRSHPWLAQAFFRISSVIANMEEFDLLSFMIDQAGIQGISDRYKI